MTQHETPTTVDKTTTATPDLDALVRRAPATDDMLELADWLTTNGVAHLSLIERIELAERLITRRRFLIGAGTLGLGVMIGCGDNGERGGNTSADTKAIENILGMTQVPIQPERVVIIDGYTGLDTAVLVDAPIVGFPYSPMIDGGFPTYLEASELSNLADIGWGEPNLERIASLSPDLIISAHWVDENVQENLSLIAPTVAFANIAYTWTEPTDWQRYVLQFAEALGGGDAAERAIAEFDERLAQVRSEIGDRLDDLTVSAVRIKPSAIQIFPGQGPGSAILKQLGVVRPIGQRPEDEPTDFSLEMIPQLDADVIFVFGLDEEEGAPSYFEQEWSTNPLWQQLQAVQASQVYIVDSAPWNHAGSVQSAHQILDDLQTHLPNVDPSVFP